MVKKSLSVLYKLTLYFSLYSLGALVGHWEAQYGFSSRFWLLMTVGFTSQAFVLGLLKKIETTVGE